MNRRYQIIIIVIVVIVGSVGYNIWTSTSDFTDAKDLVDQFYAAVKIDDMYAIERLFHPAFLEMYDMDEIDNLITACNSKLGEISSYENVKMNKRSYTGTDGSYNRIEMIYEVARLEYDSTETFQLQKEGSRYLIFGYHVNSIGFVEES